MTSKELIPDGNAAHQPDSDFDPKQLAMGVKVEQEHTQNKALAKEIAKDHLAEIPDYYTKLIKMEKEAATLPPIIQEIKRSLRRDRFADMDDFPSAFGDTYYFNIDRFRRHDHGGGEDGDDWLPDHEIDADFNEGKHKHKHQIDLVNKMLKEAGYEPNAQFDLGEKGHFDIVIQLKETDTKKVRKMLKGSNDFKSFDDPWKVMSEEDRKEANRLFKLTMKAFPSSPKQKELSDKLQAILKKYGLGNKKGAYPMAPEPEKINLKERWDNKEWNKLDGAPDEDVLTQPLRFREDKLSKKLRTVAASVKGFDSYDIKKWLEENPMNAENLEDLFNWCCDEFNVPKEKLDDVWNWCRRAQPFLEN